MMAVSKCPKCGNDIICWSCGACQQCQLDNVDNYSPEIHGEEGDYYFDNKKESEG